MDWIFEQFISAKCEFKGAGKCWIWPHHVMGNGYGGISYKKEKVFVHVLLHYLLFGEWPDKRGRRICGQAKCCRPSHIYPSQYNKQVKKKLKKDAEKRRRITIERQRRARKPTKKEKRIRRKALRIRNKQKFLERYYSKIKKQKCPIKGIGKCHIWTGCAHVQHGYGFISTKAQSWWLESNAANQRTHRLAFFLEHNRWPDKDKQVNHRCGVRLCCNPNHLYEGTKQDNTYDAINEGKIINKRKSWAGRGRKHGMDGDELFDWIVTEATTRAKRDKDMSYCWEWKYGLDPSGYGRMGYKGKNHRVHRVVFKLFNGRWPKQGLIVRHLCANRLCCNPFHLAEGTYRDNALDREKHKQKQ